MYNDECRVCALVSKYKVENAVQLLEHYPDMECSRQACAHTQAGREGFCERSLQRSVHS